MTLVYNVYSSQIKRDILDLNALIRVLNYCIESTKSISQSSGRPNGKNVEIKDIYLHVSIMTVALLWVHLLVCALLIWFLLSLVLALPGKPLCGIST